MVDHLHFPTINENEPFFFGVSYDENNHFKLGDGSKIDPIYIFMTSLKLLKNADTTSQSHQSIFHIDGTYRTNLNKFTMGSLCRSNSDRKFYLIALC